MHIKINIRKQRSIGGDLGNIRKRITLPIEHICLESGNKEITRHVIGENGSYIPNIVTEELYFIYYRNFYEDKVKEFIKYEIDKEEYDRISNILYKLNLGEIEQHNELANEDAINVTNRSHIINRGETNGILGLEI